MSALNVSTHMDDDSEGFTVASVLPLARKEDWVRDPAAFACLQRVAAMSLNDITTEAKRIKEQQYVIQKDTEDLASQNYKSFIKTADHSKNIFKEFKAVETHAASLTQSLPELASACLEFVDEAKAINEERKTVTRMLEMHQQLLEVLELPQRMDSCVKGKYYEEAIKLRNYVKSLAERHQLGIVQRVAEEVEECTRHMLYGLLEQLQGNLELSACLNITRYISSLELFSDREQRVMFLAARNICMDKALKIQHTTPHQYLKAYLDKTRTQMCTILSQYQAVFLAPVDHRKGKNPRGDIKHDWCMRRVNILLQTLQQYLPHITDHLGVVYGEASAVGSALARHGVEIRPLLTPVFERAILDTFARTTTQCFDSFTRNLARTNLASLQLQKASTSDIEDVDGTSTQMPFVLLCHNALALVANRAVTALNELRECAPLNVAHSAARVLFDVCVKTSMELQSFGNSMRSSFDQKESQGFAKLCGVYLSALVPFLFRCFRHIYPASLFPKHAQDARGTPASLFNLPQVAKPLTSFCPTVVKAIDQLYSDAWQPTAAAATSTTSTTSTTSPTVPSEDQQVMGGEGEVTDALSQVKQIDSDAFNGTPDSLQVPPLSSAFAVAEEDSVSADPSVNVSPQDSSSSLICDLQVGGDEPANSDLAAPEASALDSAVKDVTPVSQSKSDATSVTATTAESTSTSEVLQESAGELLSTSIPATGLADRVNDTAEGQEGQQGEEREGSELYQRIRRIIAEADDESRASLLETFQKADATSKGLVGKAKFRQILTQSSIVSVSLSECSTLVTELSEGFKVPYTKLFSLK
eukprot:m.333574 g.333574  ORF g.333574 m.333574 type:complete len:815 (-) comp16064_c1_seq1:2991-5435(-)